MRFFKIVFGLILSCCIAHAGSVSNWHLRNKVAIVYKAQVGVREATGKNDGPQVKAYLASVGLAEGHNWCAAVLYYCFQSSGIVSVPKSGWSPSWFPRNKTIYRRGEVYKTLNWPKSSVFGIYFPRMGRIAHVGFVDTVINNRVVTYEGNTNAQGSRVGNGFFRRLRPVGTIAAVSDFIQ